MVPWILAVLVLFVVQTYLPGVFRYGASGLSVPEITKNALGARDHVPALPAYGERAARALNNLQEAMPVFLPLALIHVHRGTEGGIAWYGAALFFAARVLYVPSYVLGVMGVRSLFWMTGHAGLVAMAYALFA